MFTDPWGLEEGEQRTYEDHEGTELETGTIEVTAKAPEGTKKEAKDVIGAKYYHENTSTFSKMPYYKHDEQWVSSLKYDKKLTNLAKGLDNSNYDPASDGFDFSEPMSDNFYVLFAEKLQHVYGTTDLHLKNTGIYNPVFGGDGIEDSPDIFLWLLPMAKSAKVAGEGMLLLSRAAVKLGQSVVSYFVERQIARLALRATQKGTSEAFVLLGKYSEGGIRYIDVEKKRRRDILFS